MDSMMDGFFGNDPFFGNRASFFGPSAEFSQGYQQNFRSNHGASLGGQPASRSTFTISFGNGPSVVQHMEGGGPFGFESFADLINAHMSRQQSADGRRPTSESIINKLPIEKI